MAAFEQFQLFTSGEAPQALSAFMRLARECRNQGSLG